MVRYLINVHSYFELLIKLWWRWLPDIWIDVLSLVSFLEYPNYNKVCYDMNMYVMKGYEHEYYHMKWIWMLCHDMNMIVMIWLCYSWYLEWKAIRLNTIWIWYVWNILTGSWVPFMKGLFSYLKPLIYTLYK